MKINLKLIRLMQIGAVVLSLLFSTFVGYSWATRPQQPVHDKVIALQKEIYAALKDPVEVERQMDYAHNGLNQNLGWGKSKNFENHDWTAFITRDYPLIRDNIQAVRNRNLYQPLNDDLTNALKLMDYAVKKQDVQALIEAHRILHDLDTFIFNPESKKNYWGVTITFEGKPKYRTKF